MANKNVLNIIEYFSFRIWLACFSLLPRFLSRSFLLFLFWSVGYCVGIRKNIAKKQLQKVFPDKSAGEVNSIIKNLYREMALTVMDEYLTSDDALFGKCAIQGKEHVTEALSLGRGAILATAHFGNWEAARILPKAGIPLSVVAKPQRNKLFDAYTNSIRERSGVKVINMRRGLRDIVHQLKEGRLVAILMDQNAGKSGLIMDFMGYPASHWKGVAKLSLRYKVPIVPGFARRLKDNTIVFEFLPYTLHEELDDTEDNVMFILSGVNQRVEAQIRKYPEQWFWVHKRWKHVYSMFG
ncbi:MAG: lysophospholipid acyltransferase family protein [Candidatus Cloacimonetes bacterium]|nr:lysophospholipid acyltransferase family protein [Candidatus Cloacimonadota bacterium]